MEVLKRVDGTLVRFYSFLSLAPFAHLRLVGSSLSRSLASEVWSESASLCSNLHWMHDITLKAAIGLAN